MAIAFATPTVRLTFEGPAPFNLKGGILAGENVFVEVFRRPKKLLLEIVRARPGSCPKNPVWDRTRLSYATEADLRAAGWDISLSR